MHTERRHEQLLDVHVDDGKSLWPLSAVSDVRHQAFQCPTSVASSGGENTVFGHDVGLERVLVAKYSTMLRKKKPRGTCAEGVDLCRRHPLGGK